MDLRQLEYVLAVSEELNFTRAAERCHVAQSALSHQISRLERELGQRLFERTSRSVRPTAGGVALAASARQILGSVARAREEVDALTGVTRGRLAIGATQTALRALDVVPLFGQYSAAYPEVRLSVTLGPMSELVERIGEGDLDLALGNRPRTLPRRLRTERLVGKLPLVAVLAADPRLTRRRTIGAAELADLGPMIEFRSGVSPRTEVDAIFRAARVRRSIAFELGQLSELVRFAAHGLGTAIVPAPFAEPAPADLPPISVLRLRDPDASVSIDAVHAPGSESVSLLAFREMLLLRLAPGRRRSRPRSG